MSNTLNTDYYRLATRSPEGHYSIGDCLMTKPEFLALMAQSGYERNEPDFGVWSSDDGFEYWPEVSYLT